MHYHFPSRRNNHRITVSVAGAMSTSFTTPANSAPKSKSPTTPAHPIKTPLPASLPTQGYRTRSSSPGVVTLVVDGAGIQGHDEWHLPSYNERNEQKYLYRIHSMDLYMWTEKDATTLLGHLTALIPADKLDIRDAPADPPGPAEHTNTMSPVVQQLEKTALGTHFPPEQRAPHPPHGSRAPLLQAHRSRPTEPPRRSSSPRPCPTTQRRPQPPSPSHTARRPPLRPRRAARRVRSKPCPTRSALHPGRRSRRRSPPARHLTPSPAPPPDPHRCNTA